MLLIMLSILVLRVSPTEAPGLVSPFLGRDPRVDRTRQKRRPEWSGHAA